MKKRFLVIVLIGIISFSFGQDSELGLRMTTSNDLTNADLWQILRSEGIQFQKAVFTGDQLKNKSFRLKAKEIWDGKIVADSTIMDSGASPYEQFRNINDTIFEIKVVAKLTSENKIKASFNSSMFSTRKEFMAHKSKYQYSLRNIVSESKMEIDYNKPFVLFAYILPYEREDNTASYCDIGTSGSDIENWGQKFGIKHYILFEMEFR